MESRKVSLAAKLAQFQDHWKPRTVAQLNSYDIMLVKVQGEFVVPRGVEHQPYAERQASVLLIEPTGTPNTGDAATAAPRQEL